MEEQKNTQSNMDIKTPNDSASINTNAINNEQPEESSPKKKKFFFWFIIALGLFALIQSILVFGKDDNKDEVVVDEPQQTIIDELVIDDEEEEPEDQLTYNTYIPPAPLVPVEEEIDLVELTIDDCIEADIVMAGINPDDINDAVVEQCLILWEDLQALLEDIEDEEVATTTPTTTPRRGGGSSGGGSVTLSDDASLNLFKVDVIDALVLPDLEVESFDDAGAKLFVDNHLCSDIELSANPCVDQLKQLVGIFLQPTDEDITYIKVEIERLSPLPVELVWENEEILQLHEKNILVGDIIMVTVIAEDATSQNLYKLSILGDVVNDASLSLFNVDFIDVLPLAGLQVNNFSEEGANLILSDYQCERSSFSNVRCISEKDNLTGIFIEPRDPDFSYIKVEIKRLSLMPVELVWENEEILQLHTEDILLGDVIRVTVVSEDGKTTSLYKVNISDESFIDTSLNKFAIDKYDILSLENLEIKDKSGAVLYINDAEDCPDWSDHVCTTTKLKGLIVSATQSDVSYIGVSLLRDKVWKLWENDEIHLLAQEEFFIDDVVLVRVVSKNAWHEAMYKVTIKAAPTEIEEVVITPTELKLVKIKPRLVGGGGSAPAKIEKEPINIEPIQITPVEKIKKVQEKPVIEVKEVTSIDPVIEVKKTEAAIIE